MIDNFSEKNIVLITSILHPPNLPLSYINTRSIYSPKERLKQTEKTIISVRKNIPNCIIFLVDCSPLEIEEVTFLKNNTDIFINLFDFKNQDLINKVYSPFKALGEATLTTFAINFLIENNIDFDSFFKISGRYWLNSNFNYENFKNKLIIYKKINNSISSYLTCIYKLPNTIILEWLNFLNNSTYDMYNGTGAESIFANFINSLKIEKLCIEKIGISGNIAVSGDFIDE